MMVVKRKAMKGIAPSHDFKKNRKPRLNLTSAYFK